MTPRTLSMLAVPALALVLAVAFALALGATLPAVGDAAPCATPGGLEDDGCASWQLEQPAPPPPPPGVQGSSTPIGLGKIGDIEFWAPAGGPPQVNRGLLITAGNPPTVPPGLWAYNGKVWHELSTVCGATDGRVAWAGPEEFWTVSDGRPGQVASGLGGIPPLEDNTLCHFAGGQVIASYAHPAFQPDSYQAMHAAGCIFAPGAQTSSDCWFAGDPLPEPQIGAFQLHWNGSSLEAEPYPAEGHAIEDMRSFEEHLYESVRVSPGDRVTEEQLETPVVHRINPEGVQPAFQPERGLPLSVGEEPNPLDYLQLTTADGALWAAAGGGAEGGGQVTVLRRAGGQWSQLLGPATNPSGEKLFGEEVVSAFAAEPGTGSAWLGLDSRSDARKPSPTASAVVARISAEGKITDEQTLPSSTEIEAGIGPKGAVAKIACPAPEDCWLTTTQGWLFHLSTPAGRAVEEAAPDTDLAFANLITFRPHDEGLLQVPPDAPPPDTSGLVEEPPPYGGAFAESSTASIKQKISVALLSHLHSRLLHGDTLELRFHLAVKARVRLLAKRHKQLVASTPMRTLAAGNRELLLGLNPHSWPTKLDLQTHALAPLPTVTVNQPVGGPEHGGVGANTVGTGFTVLPDVPSFAGSGSFGGSGSLPRSGSGSGSPAGSGSLP